jgi:predicted PurR-regulated permease PerM
MADHIDTPSDNPSGIPSAPYPPYEPSTMDPLLGRRPLRPQEILAIVGGFGLLALLIVSVVGKDAAIHPVFPLAALIFFLYQFRKIGVPRRIIQLGIIIFVVWLFVTLSGVLFPFIVAFMIAYLFSPLVEKLARIGIRRWMTSIGIVLGILGLYALVGIFVVPGLLDQFNALFGSTQAILKDTSSLLDKNSLVRWLTSIGLPQKQAEELVTNSIDPQVKEAYAWIFQGFKSFLRNVSFVLEGIINLILIPILTLNFLVDFHKIRRFVAGTLLRDNPVHVYYVRNVDLILSSYMRGILLTSSLVAVMSVTVLSIFGVPYAVLLGILTGVFNLIPTVGMFLNLGVAIVIFLFTGGSFWEHTLIMATMIAGLHAFNAYIVEPRVIGERVGLHPVILIASLFIFGEFLGFIGLVIAVPTTAVILMFLKEWYKRVNSQLIPTAIINAPTGE